MMRRFHATKHELPFLASGDDGGRIHDYAGKGWGFEPTPHPTSAGSVSSGRVIPRRRRLFVFLVATICLIGVLGGRLVSLQFARGTVLRAAAESNRVRSDTITALRGIFTDRNGEPLVRNVPNFTLVVEPKSLPSDADRDTDAATVAHVLNEDPGAFTQEVNERTKGTETEKNGKKYVTVPAAIVLREHLATDQALALMLRTRTGLPGYRIEEQPLREYLGGPAFAPLLGYVGKLTSEEYTTARHTQYAITDTIGKTGLERSEEPILKGKNGTRRTEIDAQGNRLRVLETIEPEAGPTVRLTIDRALQQVAYDTLLASIEATKSTGGAAIAIDPRNGEVRAFVSAPSYDPNLFSTRYDSDAVQRLLDDERQPLFHRALQGQYPSGSTIKPFVSAIGLDEGVITPSTTVRSTGGIRIGQWFFPDWKAGGHGLTDVRRAIADSINTFFYMVGGGFEEFKGLGIRRLVEGLTKFGFGLATGIELNNEASGFLPTPEWKESVKHESWYIGDTYHLAIGQGDILVTPLQMALATAVVANGGTLYRPHLVDAIESSDHGLLDTSADVTRNTVVPTNDLTVVREGMRLTVTAGSAKAMQSAPVPVAAKTGTAQYGGDGKTHAWFTAFAPYENPELVIAVLVEGGGEGGAAAQPVARAMIDAYFKPAAGPTSP